MDKPDKKFLVIGTVSTTPTRKDKVGTFVERIGDLVILRFEDGKELPFHYTRLEECTSEVPCEKRGYTREVETNPSWSSTLPYLVELLLEPEHRSKAMEGFTEMAEEADSIKGMQDDVMESFAVLLKVIDRPELASKHKTELDELRNKVNEYKKRYTAYRNQRMVSQQD